MGVQHGQHPSRNSPASPDFSLTVILTVALGVGANTAIFTLVHAVLLKSLPVSDPKTLFRVGEAASLNATQKIKKSQRDDGIKRETSLY